MKDSRLRDVLMGNHNRSTTYSTNGLTLMFILFLGLKLAGIGAVANWSWWWVTAPLWALPAFVLSCAAVVGLLALVAILIAMICERFR